MAADVDEGRDRENGVQGLLTRHVFVDTEVYRGFGYNLNSAPLQALGLYINEGVLHLHTTDITLSEIKRHIHEDATKLALDVSKLNQQFDRWRSRVPNSLIPKIETIDADELGRGAYMKLRHKIRIRWNATEHLATEASAGPVFESYFERRPPFDDANSKEFPDAFVLSALENWCVRSRSTMYVVTADKAMRRAAKDSASLISVVSLLEFLSIVTAAETPEILEVVERLLASPKFIERTHDFLRDRIGWLGIIYVGELDDGEAYESDVAGEPEIEDYSVLSASPTTISLLLRVKVPLLVQVSYDDLSDAIYDREDGRYFGAQRRKTEIQDEPIIRLAVTIDRENETIEDFDFVTQDIYVSESTDVWD